MDSVRVERLDHGGVSAAVSNDWGLIDMINARLVPDAPEVLTPGDAVAGMLLNGLGCAHRPWSLAPQCCASQPLDLLVREGLAAGMFYRVTLGRTLDEAHADGGDLWLQKLARVLWAHAGLDLRCKQLDTTRFALRGEYVPERAAHAITITHGDSRAHRPDVKPAVWALMGAHDGGVPCVSKRGEGHTSDREMVQARAPALMTAFKHAPNPRYLMADAKRSQADHTPNLHALGLIPRLPNTIGPVSPVITPALTGETGLPLEETTRDQRRELCPSGLAQRGRVVPSQATLARAEATVNQASQREDAAIATPLFHLQARRFPTPEAAQGARGTLTKGWTYHQGDARRRTAHQRSTGKGRPTPKTPLKPIAWHIAAHSRPEDEALRSQQQGQAGVGLGTHICASQVSDTEVMAAYKGQARVAGGVRCLNDPLLCVSAWLVKQPARIPGLLMVMTLALWVDSVGQRRGRQPRAQPHPTVPNHINHPTTSPTVRWVFQLWDGMHRVRVRRHGQVHALIAGLNDVQINVRRLLGEQVGCLDQISPRWGCSMSVSIDSFNIY